MEINADPWLGSIAGLPVLRISEPAQADEIPRLAQVVAEAKDAFLYSKVSTRDVASVRHLSLAGMYVVDVNVVFELRKPVTAAPPSEAEIRPYQSSDKDAVLAVAESAYEQSRFHLDPLFPRAIANRIKREWCHNYIKRERGDRLFVASMRGQPVGFLAALKAHTESGEAAVVDLIGVSRDARNRGVGGALVGAFVDHYRPQTGILQVGTQVANTTSIRLYERLGFSLIKGHYVLHMHVRDGKTVR